LPNPNADVDPLNRISFISSDVSITQAEDPSRPKRVLGFRDLVLFYVVTGISLPWIAAGPSSIVGALAMWIPVGIVVVMGLIAWHRYGSATPFTLHSMMPSTHLNDIIFWSVLTFAFGGCETASFMGEEIKNPRRSILFALLFGGATVTLCYILGTADILLALPSSEVSSLQGLVQAISKTAARAGFPGVLPVAAFLIALSNIGAAGAYLAAVARLPFVAGIDRFLPPRIWPAPPTLENSLGRTVHPVLSRRALHFSRPRRHQR
jgi:amino acid transporter